MKLTYAHTHTYPIANISSFYFYIILAIAFITILANHMIADARIYPNCHIHIYNHGLCVCVCLLFLCANLIQYHNMHDCTCVINWRERERVHIFNVYTKWISSYFPFRKFFLFAFFFYFIASVARLIEGKRRNEMKKKKCSFSICGKMSHNLSNSVMYFDS